MAGFDSFISIDGFENPTPLPYAQPVIIPVTPGVHAVEVIKRTKIFKKGRAGEKKSITVTVAPYTVLPLVHRMCHTTIGPMFNGFKFYVLKPGEPRQFNPNGNFPFAMTASQPNHQYGPPHQQPYVPPQHHQQYAPPQYQPQAAAAPQFNSPFTDAGNGQQTATSSAGASTKTKYCTQCGSELVAGNRFCGY